MTKKSVDGSKLHATPTAIFSRSKPYYSSSATPAAIPSKNVLSNSSYSPSDIVLYTRTSATPPHLFISAPQRYEFAATNFIFRLLEFLSLTAPGRAEVIRLEEQPEIVQTLFRWSGVFYFDTGCACIAGPYYWVYGVAPRATKSA